MFVLSQGIEQILVFIPADWGGLDEDGVLKTARSSIAYTLALVFSFFLVHVFDRFEKLRAENDRLSVAAEIQNRERGLRHQSREALIERRSETEAALKELDTRFQQGRFPSHGERERRILRALLADPDRRMARAPRTPK